MSYINIILKDLTKHPKCPHGPTILFSRTSNGEQTNFFACSACRDRKDCSFYLRESEKDKVSVVKKNKWSREIQNYLNGIQHRKQFVLFNEIQQLLPKLRTYCNTCNQFVCVSYKQKHEQHEIKENITDYSLTHPSEFLAPLDNPKKEAQFLFAKAAIETIIDIVRQQNLKTVISMGAPRVHEYIAGNRVIPRQFNQTISPTTSDFYETWGKDLVIIMDPPFGGRIELLAQTIASINALNKKINDATSDIPVLLIFPYFMEPQILNSFPEFVMIDYKVDYDNHVLFRGGPKGRKQGSPVRIFTNINPSGIVLPADQGYKYCKQCNRWVSTENKHCNLCNSCTSKDGRTYLHCNECDRCVKPTWIHCADCHRCAQKDHDCKKIVFTQACFHCKELGHKKRDCPNVNRDTLHIKRRKGIKIKSKKQKVSNK